eukprot:scaffold97604_cov57-Phaeocystis_antarctica.AAC.3
MAYLFASYGASFGRARGPETNSDVCRELFRVVRRDQRTTISLHESLQRSNTVKTQDENGAKCRGGHTGTCHAQIKPVQYHNNQKVAVASLHMESRSRPLLPHTSMRRAPPHGSPGSTPPHQFQRSPMLRRAPLMHRPSRPHHGLG